MQEPSRDTLVSAHSISSYGYLHLHATCRQCRMEKEDVVVLLEQQKVMPDGVTFVFY